MAVLQMTWQPSILSHKRKSSPPVGLRNLGNTCYLNSVLQCLTYTPPLANFCLNSLHSSSCDAAPEKKSECPFCILEKRIARSLNLDSALDTPAKINSCLKIFAQHFRNGRQEDAHEFLRYVIDACHNTCLRLKKLQQQRKKVGIGSAGSGDGNGGSIVKEIFGGALQSQVKCLSCGVESNKVDEIMDISLDVLHSSSLKDALQKFFQPEILDGNNKYKCEKCNKLVAARKQMSILQAPNVLVIQLKRFEGIFGGKIDKLIAFEEILVLSSYMCKASQDTHPEYKLFGAIVHSGFSPDSGHYYAYIKDAMGRWYCCNDSYVSHSSLQDVLSEKVYILFFSRSKQRPPSAKKCLPSNGSKSNEPNGTGKTEIPKGHLPKPESTMQFSGHQSEINNSTSKVDKVTGIFEKTNIKKSHTPGNIKIVVHQRELGNKNGVEKGLLASSLPDRNGFSKSNSNGKTTRPSSLSNGNGKLQTLAADTEGDFFKENGHSKKETSDHKELLNGKKETSDHKELLNGKRESSDHKESLNGKKETSDHKELLNGKKETSDHKELPSGKKETSDHKELLNGNGKSSFTGSSLKRKSPEPCFLLSEDGHSSVKMEVFKKELIKEASSALQSCGWTENVYAFMKSKKKLCAQGVINGASDYDEEKRRLIADAKAKFISQIPEPLKSGLIERLRSFHREEKHITGTQAHGI